MNDERGQARVGLSGEWVGSPRNLAASNRLRAATACMTALALAVALVACGAPATSTPAPAPSASAATAPASPTLPLPPSPFPPMVAPPDNPTTPAKVELGRQLFYDPVLSASDAMACATCHHPDLGFSNAAAISAPRAGAPGRNVPALWNVGFNRHLLWDGRVESLEAQAVDPLTMPNEMAASPAEIEAELAAIPAYVELFDSAFGGGQQAVTFDNVTRALAAFQRTLLSRNSPYDRFVVGDTSALTPQEQRGLAIFLSPEAACAECHQPPTFSHETFRVVGVPSEDPGRAGVSPTGIRGAFKVPTLRNVALTAPYMHNGSLATLEEVVQFYADGAGRANGFPSVDPVLKGFELSEQDKADLVAFLHALTDEGAVPAVPKPALSGLPSVPRIDRPPR